jgi:energy-coupling factor transport system permease protein
MAAFSVFALVQGCGKQALGDLFLFGLFAGLIRLYRIFGWSDEILSRYALILGRNTMPVFFAFHILALTPPSEICAALDSLGFPKATGIVIVTLFRYFPTAGSEIRRVGENARIRGLGGFGALLHPARSLSYVLLPLLVRALNVGEELSVAAVSRGAESPAGRHSLYEKSFDALDGVWLFLFIAGGVCFLLLPVGAG